MVTGQSIVIARAPFYRRRGFKRLISVIVATLFILVVAAIVMFLLWWSSPEKALLDAANYAAQTPGSYRVTAKGTNLNVTIRDQEYAASGTFNGITMNAVLYGGSLYLKAPQPDQIYDLFMGTKTSQQIPAVIQSIIPGIAGKWITVDLNNITLGAQSAKTTQCIFQEKESISHDPNARRQWAAVYLAHRFLDIRTTKQATTTTYEVSVNTHERTDFFAALQKTSFYQSLTNCSSSTDIFAGLGNQSPLADIVMAKSQHVMQSMVINPRSKDPITITANYRAVPAIDTPTDAISTDQLLLRSLGSLGGL